MLIAKIIPPDSSLYKRLSGLAKSLDGFMEYRPLDWFWIWTMFVAGMGTHAGYVERHFFWEFTPWHIGILSLAVVTYIVAVFVLKRGILKATPTVKEIGVYSLFGLALFLLGWGSNPLVGIKYSIPYLLFLIAVMFVFAIPLNKDEKSGEVTIASQSKKRVYVFVALLLTVAATVIGYYLDDPVASTASVVYLPFLVVASVTSHVRHVQRSRIFSIFIMAMFVSAREAWFLIPLVILFYALRYYYYFRHQIVYPTFSVHMDEEQ
ncbi:MAG: hypothetical protein GXO92_02455 [FCB group bacterium]|nr:hypothetical protein [FCB group bacterium]